MDYTGVNAILSKNSDKNFVRRILFPENYPTLPEGDGQVATHKMAWSDDDGAYYVYPTVVQGENGELVELDPDEAFDYALKNREFIKFKDPQQADEFSQEYKKYWQEIGFRP